MIAALGYGAAFGVFATAVAFAAARLIARKAQEQTRR